MTDYKPEQIVLTDEKYEEFRQITDRPVKDNEAFQRLVERNRQSKWKIEAEYAR